VWAVSVESALCVHIMCWVRLRMCVCGRERACCCVCCVRWKTGKEVSRRACVVCVCVWVCWKSCNELLDVDEFTDVDRWWCDSNNKALESVAVRYLEVILAKV